jgi:hypothetical protein
MADDTEFEAKCPDCSLEMQPIKLLDATDSRRGGHKGARYGGIDVTSSPEEPVGKKSIPLYVAPPKQAIASAHLFRETHTTLKPIVK